MNLTNQYTALPWPDRFWAKTKPAANGCIEWTDALNYDGYGRIGIGGNRKARAHRMAWELTHGPVPRGLYVCHRCDNRRCVNVAHLFLGTHADNTADMVRKDRQASDLRNPTTKIPSIDIPAILSAIWAGVASQAEVARVYGVRSSTISRLVTGMSGQAPPGGERR